MLGALFLVETLVLGKNWLQLKELAELEKEGWSRLKGQLLPVYAALGVREMMEG